MNPTHSKLTLYIVRGLPGAGKSTTAERLKDRHAVAAVVSADDWFERGGKYDFNPAELKQAHADCLARAKRHLERGQSVAVANTFTMKWEIEPYLEAAREYGADVKVLEPDGGFDAGLSDSQLASRNLHGVGAEGIGRMRARWEAAWDPDDGATR